MVVVVLGDDNDGDNDSRLKGDDIAVAGTSGQDIISLSLSVF